MPVIRCRAVAASAVLLAGALVVACGAGSGPTGTSTAASTAASSVLTTTPTPSTPSPRSPGAVTVRSPAFAAGTTIPSRFSCRGSNTPPPLRWSAMPDGTASVALVMDDPDAVGGTYVHWVVVNLPAASRGITGPNLPDGAVQARNSGGDAAYLGPCPPSGTHRYRFTVYAENVALPLQNGAPLPDALAAITAHAIVRGRLIGLFGHG